MSTHKDVRTPRYSLPFWFGLLGLLFLLSLPIPAYAQGICVIASTATDPGVIRPGMEFTLSLSVKNQTTDRVTDVITTLETASLAVPGGRSPLTVVSTGASRVLGDIGYDGSKNCSFRLLTDAGMAPGAYSIPVVINYGDSSGTKATITDSVSVVVRANSSSDAAPAIYVGDSRTDSATVTPGSEFTLTTTIRNDTAARAENVLVTLDTASIGGATRPPFAVVGSGRSHFVGTILGASGNTCSFRLLSDPSAPAGVYSIPVLISYWDSAGAKTTLADSVSVVVTATPIAEGPSLLYLGNAETDPKIVRPGMAFSLSAVVRNDSGMKASAVMVTIDTVASAATAQPPFAVLGTGRSRMLGDIAARSSGSFDFHLLAGPSAAPGAYSVPVIITYMDSTGSKVTVNDSLTVVVISNPTFSAGASAYISVSRTSPGTIRPGDEFTLSATVRNDGPSRLDAVMVTVDSLSGTASSSAPLFVVLHTGRSRLLGNVESAGSDTCEFVLVCDSSTAPGAYNVPLSITYTGKDGSRITVGDSASVIISSAGNPGDLTPPRLTKAKTDPASVQPGSGFDAVLTIRNDGDVSARAAVVTIGTAPMLTAVSQESGPVDADGRGGRGSFAVIGSGSTRTLGSLLPREETSCRFSLTADPELAPGVYFLPVTITYVAQGGTVRTASDSIGILVSRSADFFVDIQGLDRALRKGKRATFEFGVTNSTAYDADGVVLSVRASSMQPRHDELFLGRLQQGEGDVLEAEMSPLKPGHQEVVFEVRWRDDFGVERSKVTTQVIDVRDSDSRFPRSSRDSGSSSRLLLFLKGLLGLG